jgi:plastocyanin
MPHRGAGEGVYNSTTAEGELGDTVRGIAFPALVLLIAMVTATACGGGSAPAPGEEKKAGGTPPAKGEVMVIEVKEGGVPTRFVPNFIEIKKGTTVKFIFSSLDNVTHTFTARTVGIDLEASPGVVKESEPVTFKQVATILFNCQFHTSLGGLGTIKVTD